jgi:hypothetical protein
MHCYAAGYSVSAGEYCSPQIGWKDSQFFIVFQSSHRKVIKKILGYQTQKTASEYLDSLQRSLETHFRIFQFTPFQQELLSRRRNKN